MDDTLPILDDVRPDAHHKVIRETLSSSRPDPNVDRDQGRSNDQHDAMPHPKVIRCLKDLRQLSERSLRFLIFQSKEPAWLKQMAMRVLWKGDQGGGS